MIQFLFLFLFLLLGSPIVPRSGLAAFGTRQTPLPRPCDSSPSARRPRHASAAFGIAMAVAARRRLLALLYKKQAMDYAAGICVACKPSYLS